MEIKNRRAFWEKQHQIKNRSTLSGCTYGETVRYLQLIPHINRDAKVLEVGVGLGYVTQELYVLTAGVWALDISNEALERVRPYIRSGYLVEQMVALPSDFFDVVICHNLIQHIPTELLREELSHLIRSIRPEVGVIAVEFVSGDDIQDSGDVVRDEFTAGSYLRSVEFMKGLVESLGGICELKSSDSCKIGQVTGVHVIHIRK